MKRVLKWGGIVLGVLLVTTALLFFIGNTRLNKMYDFPPSNIVIPTDAASIEAGKHWATTLCQGCHGSDLSGVENWFDGGPLGRIDSANLTSGEGGVGRDFSDEDFVRAVRHGIDPAGRPIFMPAVVSTQNLSDEDLGAIVAYIRSVTPVDHVTQGRHFTPLAKILFALGMLGNMPVEDVSHDLHVSAPAPAVSTEYGKYLVDTHDCRLCHGQNLNGGDFPDPTVKKISPNITPGGEIGFWTEEQFINTFRTGTTPNGHKLNPDYMPWKEFLPFYDDELKAIYIYLQSLPKLPQYSE